VFGNTSSSLKGDDGNGEKLGFLQRDRENGIFSGRFPILLYDGKRFHAGERKTRKNFLGSRA